MIQLHLQKPHTIHRCETITLVLAWSPTPEGTAVVNVDATLFEASSRMGVGVVIRYHNGEFLAAHSQLLDEIMMPKFAKAHAIRCAVSLALDKGLDRLRIETDC
jgi:hypothetical protein